MAASDWNHRRLSQKTFNSPPSMRWSPSCKSKINSRRINLWFFRNYFSYSTANLRSQSQPPTHAIVSETSLWGDEMWKWKTQWIMRKTENVISLMFYNLQSAIFHQTILGRHFAISKLQLQCMTTCWDQFDRGKLIRCHVVVISRCKSDLFCISNCFSHKGVAWASRDDLTFRHRRECAVKNIFSLRPSRESISCLFRNREDFSIYFFRFSLACLLMCDDGEDTHTFCPLAWPRIEGKYWENLFFFFL